MADAAEVTESNEVTEIKRQMVEQRHSLADKLETLESQVTEKVEQATNAVTNAVATVTDTVQASVETVRDTMNLRRQVELHPWAMVGGSVAVGMLGAWLLHGKKEGKEHSPRAPASSNGELMSPAIAPAMEQPKPQRPSWLAKVGEELRPELQQVKALAIGALAGLLRDAVADVTPEPFRPEMTDVADRITQKLGGQPVHGRVLAPDTTDEPRPI